MRKFQAALIVLFYITLVACQPQIPAPASETTAPAPSATITSTPPATASPTASPTATATPTTEPSRTPTSSSTSTSTSTPTHTITPTPAAPLALVQQLSHCRYGPGTAYLHSHDLHPGDVGIIEGRNDSGTWLWILPDGLERHCWVAASLVAVQGDLASLPMVTSRLPYSNLYGPPENVQAERDGPEVTITWDPIGFTVDDDRGYMLSLNLCSSGQLMTQTIQTYDTIVTVFDEKGCSQASSGALWGVEKHGYTQPVVIPWPEA